MMLPEMLERFRQVRHRSDMRVGRMGCSADLAGGDLPSHRDMKGLVQTAGMLNRLFDPLSHEVSSRPVGA